MAAKKDLSGLSREERIVWGRVSRQLRAAGVELRNLQTNLRTLEASTSVYKQKPEYTTLYEALTLEIAQKQAVFEGLAAELTADAETRAAAEYTLADLAKSDAALKKGGKKDRRAQSGWTDPSLKYRLREMPLIDSGDDTPTYVPEVVSSGHVSDADFRKLLSTGTTIQSADVTAGLCNIRERLVQMLSSGYSVSLGDMFIIKPGLRGTCIGKEAEAYGRRKFLPVVNVRVMPNFAKAIRKMTSIGPAQNLNSRNPFLTKLTDLTTGTSGTLLRPGSTLCIKGEGLDFNPAAEDEGFFLDATGRPCQTYRLSVCVVKDMIKPKQAIFALPADLPSGAVGRLVLRRRLRNSDRLNGYEFPESVTVV